MRYFYDMRFGEVVVRDEEGSEHLNLAAAEAEAIEAAREIMATAILEGRDVSGNLFEIADERGQVVSRFPFRDAIVRGRSAA